MSKEILRKKFLDIAESLQLVIDRFEGINEPADFLKDDGGLIKYDSILIRLLAIGEALKKVSKKEPGLLEQFPDIDWSGIMGLRDVISHHYFDLDAEVIFKICNEEIIPLQETANKILSDLNKS